MAYGKFRIMFRPVTCPKIFRALVFLLPFLLPALSWGDADKIYRDNSPAVVVVVAFDGGGRPLGQGSGFIVREDGAVVTNYHVVNMAKDIKIKVGEKVRDTEGVLHIDPDNDLAIVKLKGSGYPTVALGDAGKLQVGEKVYAIGSPRGLENTISEGILSGIREIDPKRRILQMTAPISPGSSGGPVFNAIGEVVGIATFLIAETQNLNFAMPVNLIRAGLTKREVVSPGEACRVDYTETASCWFYQGLAYGAAGRYDSAADSFKRSLAMDSKRVETYINLGVSYANLRKFQEATEMFLQALKIQPNEAEALSRLGAVYSELGRYRDAIATFGMSVEIEPSDPQTHYNLAVTYGRMDEYRKAADAAKEAIRLAPKYTEAHICLGMAYTKLGMHPEAAVEFKTAIRLDPEDPRTHLGLGKTYASMGERASALEEYKILKQMNPKLADELFDVIYK
jgi:tetratricopeptide (TPR) repeat protein